MKSLEQRLFLGLVTVLLVTFSLLLVFSIQAIKDISEAYVSTRLEHDAEALLSSLKKQPHGAIRLRNSRITPIYQQPFSGHYFQFEFDHGESIRSRSLWDESLQTLTVPLGQVVYHRVSGPSDQKLLSRTGTYEKFGQPFTLTVAEDIQPVEDTIANFQMIALLVLGITLVIIFLLLRYVLRRGFRVLDQVRTEVTEISMGQSQQIKALGPSEIQPLTTEINRLLSQILLRLKRSRDALGNLAHALKGPLSLLTHDIDKLAIEETEKQNLNRHVSRVSLLVDRELKRARLSSGQVGQYFNPVRAVPDLVDALKRIYHDRNLEINVLSLPDQALPLDHEDMLEMLGNLLDNACKWASKTITISIFDEQDFKVLIEDDGPGVEEQDYAEMLNRGSRLDEQEKGYGLGIAIVNDLVRDYQGELAFSRSSTLGGLKVSVTLPLVRQEKKL